MKKWWSIVVAAVLVLMASSASAQAGAEGRPAGWGIGLGSGTGVGGISLKSQGDPALQGVVGCGWHWRGRGRGGCRGLAASGDLLIPMPVITDEGTVRLAWNLGGGAAVGLGSRYYGDGITIAGQFVAGLEFIFPEIPLDVVLEWRPSLFLVPDGWLDEGHVGFHVRYYFQ